MIRLEINCEPADLPDHITALVSLTGYDLTALVRSAPVSGAVHTPAAPEPEQGASGTPAVPAWSAPAPGEAYAPAAPASEPEETPKKGRGRPRKAKTYDVFSFDDDVALGVTPKEAVDFLVDRIGKQDTQERIEQLLTHNADTLKALKDTGKAVYQAAQARVDALKPDAPVASEVPTPEHARAVLLDLGNREGGMTKVLDLLARFDVSSVSQVGDDKRAEFVAAVKAALEGAA